MSTPRSSSLLILALCAALPFLTACPDPNEPLENDLELINSENHSDGESDGDGELPEDVDASDLPNALGAGGHALLPWPSDQHMGKERKPAAELLPTAFTSLLLEGSGASRIMPIVTYLPGGVDPSSLPPADQWGATLEAGSSIAVVVLQEGEEPARWPMLAEIDATAPNRAEATLLLRPHRPFPAESTVVVGLTSRLRTHACSIDEGDQDCVNHEPLPALARVLDGTPEGRAEQSWMGAPRDALLAALPYLAEERGDLVQAFSFTVRGSAEIIDPMVAMQNEAAAFTPENYTLQEIDYRERRADIYGRVEVPWFLGDDDTLVVDENGLPVVQEYRNVPFLVTIPRTITEPRPVVLFGHGFFSAIEESTWSNLFNGLEQWEMAAVTTRFFGFAEVDLPKAVGALTGETLDGMRGIIDLQRQSQVNFTVIHNLIATELASVIEVDFGDGPFHPLDGSKIPYMGISNGGTQGLVMMSTSPVLTRGALVVPGGGWSHMLQRAAQWSSLGLAFSNRYRNRPAELQVAMSMMQLIFDPVDSLNFVDHLIHDRLPSAPETPDILIVEALEDSQVANMVSRWVGGTAQVTQLLPAPAQIWDVPSEVLQEGDELSLPWGYEIYDLGVEPHPPGNIAATENGVHDQVRLLPEYRLQMGIFLEEGRIVRTY